MFETIKNMDILEKRTLKAAILFVVSIIVMFLIIAQK